MQAISWLWFYKTITQSLFSMIFYNRCTYISLLGQCLLIGRYYIESALKIVTTILILFTVSPYSNSQVIAAAQRVDWTVAGLQQPTPIYTHRVDITSMGGNGNGTTPNDNALQAAIGSLGTDSGTIYFPAGTYAFVSPVMLRSGLVLRGQDATSTMLLFNLSGSDNLISIEGNNTNVVTGIAAQANKNEYSVIVRNSSLLNTGDYVKLFQNDSALVLDIFRCVGQVLHIKNIVGDTVSFDSPLRRNYNYADSLRLQKISMVTGVGIECLKIKRLDSTATQQANIWFNYAARCWIKGVESDSANFAHVTMSNCTNIEITGSYFHGSFGYGAGGQGYGISCNRTTGECLVENNIFSHLRHSMLIQSGSNGNVFSYNYSRQPFKSETAPNDLAGDIVLHGNYPYANLFEGNIVQNIVSDASHNTNGPFNTFFRNRAELYGILFNSGCGDSSNIVGNEITSALFNHGLYFLNGIGNFEYGNNVRGTIYPPGTTTLADSSYYYPSEPYFWLSATPWPSIGTPNPFNTRTIPAKARYDAAVQLTVCPPDNILPLHFLSFAVSKEKSKNYLQWVVGKSLDRSTFGVERSEDGIHFKMLQQIASSTLTTFSYDDKMPPKTINYYRIKEQHVNGGYDYSKSIQVDNRENGFVHIFPNPVSEELNVEAVDVSNLSAVVRSTTGTAFYTPVSINGNLLKLNTSRLPNGFYFIHLTNKFTGNSTVYKFLKK